jgi:hypothetical protein
MANFTITIPDDKVQPILDAFANQLNRPLYILDPDWIDPEDGTTHPVIDNTETKAQFAKRMLIEYVKTVYSQEVRDQARRASKQAVLDAIAAVDYIV